MKVILCFKSPDVLYHATNGMSDEDREEVMKAAEHFLKYGEYLNVELDTEQLTARVIKQ